jgi:hypothetical protein
MGMERGPLSLMSTIEELLERKSSGSKFSILQFSEPFGMRDGVICNIFLVGG